MGRRPKQTFLLRKHTDGQQRHEKIINFANYQRNAKQNYNHFTLIRMANIKKSTNNKWWRECGEKGILLQCWWEYKLVQPLWKTLWRLHKKLKIELQNEPAIPLLGFYPEKTKILILKGSSTTKFIAALFTTDRLLCLGWAFCILLVCGSFLL